MKLIQIPLLLIILFALVKTVRRFREGRIRALDLTLWIALWVAGALAILFPDRSNDLAHALGVTRGADLVLYIAVVVLLYLVLQAHVRIEWVKGDITRMTRRLALRDLTEGRTPGSEPDEDGGAGRPVPSDTAGETASLRPRRGRA